MSNIEEIVFSLEQKIGKILLELDVLKKENKNLNDELTLFQQKIKLQQDDIFNWEEQYNTLKIANSLLGSDDNNRETKLKINTLIKDLDHCIAQLSE